MKQVIFKRDDGYYMTSVRNYHSYIWDARKVKKLNDVKTLDEVMEFIDKACVWFDAEPSDFAVVA